MQLAVELGDDDAVVVAVGDEQPVARLVGQNLAGKAQRRVGWALSTSRSNRSGVSSSMPLRR